ncbi:MAG: hypothetical protein C4542_03435 [Dehalococcoidia bacterium]|nr:MAG: hypothetical protein C4542_03435 [Dehalococcoidia bacterium]
MVGAGDGTATIALSAGTDLAGNGITAAPTSGATFTVDNTTTVPPPTTTVTGTGSVDVSGNVNAGGQFIGPVTLSSADNNITINIPAGIIGTTSAGQPLSLITVTQISGPPAPPPTGENIISGLYEFGPSGARFSSPITMTLSYDPTKLASGVSETSLVIAYYSVSEGQWIILGGIVDTVNHTITVQVDHFTAFAVIGRFITTTTTTTPTTGIWWLIGSIIAVVLIIVLVVWWRMKRRKRN